jgi:hypothetical protein
MYTTGRFDLVRISCGLDTRMGERRFNAMSLKIDLERLLNQESKPYEKSL